MGGGSDCGLENEKISFVCLLSYQYIFWEYCLLLIGNQQQKSTIKEHKDCLTHTLLIVLNLNSTDNLKKHQEIGGKSSLNFY